MCDLAIAVTEVAASDMTWVCSDTNNELNWLVCCHPASQKSPITYHYISWEQLHGRIAQGSLKHQLLQYSRITWEAQREAHLRENNSNKTVYIFEVSLNTWACTELVMIVCSPFCCATLCSDDFVVKHILRLQFCPTLFGFHLIVIRMLSCDNFFVVHWTLYMCINYSVWLQVDCVKFELWLPSRANVTVSFCFTYWLPTFNNQRLECLFVHFIPHWPILDRPVATTE